MYCVIQEVQRKKPNFHGEYKKLEADMFTINGFPKYGYQYTGDRFERPIKTAYKISIHESKRVNGVVTKKQYVITTVDYYTFTEDYFTLGNYDDQINSVAEKLNADVGILYNILNKKIIPLQKRIQEEFQQTEEYIVHAEHEKILKLYRKEKSDFAKMYECDESEYDYCFNIFGELMNQNYYEKIINAHKTNRNYHERKYDNHSRYDSNNYNFGGNNNSFDSKAGVYTEDEKVILKNLYRTLSKAYHPDITKSDGKEMKLINKLKESWDI